MHPIAMEGALKLKEISYIHAEAYPAGELKHGPLALVDAEMPVIAVAPNNDLLEKLKSNLQEVRARGGELYVFADPESGIEPSDGVTVIQMPRHVSYTAGAGGLHGSATAARVSLRDTAGHGRRPAAEPRQVASPSSSEVDPGQQPIPGALRLRQQDPGTLIANENDSQLY